MRTKSATTGQKRRAGAWTTSAARRDEEGATEAGATGGTGAESSARGGSARTASGCGSRGPVAVPSAEGTRDGDGDGAMARIGVASSRSFLDDSMVIAG